MATDHDGLTTERVGTTEVITLDNPDALNALTPDMVDGLVATLRAAAEDRRCRAVVLTGTGDRAFCAGIDVKGVADRDAAAGSDESALDPVLAGFENLHHGLGAMIRTIHTLPIPVIAAVNGHAIGAGFALAAAADLRVIGSSARFTDGFVTRGISGCELGLSYFLPRLVGAATAFDWMMTGRRISADEAAAAGFAPTPVDPDTTLAVAMASAERIASLAPAAVSMTKEVMWANLHAASLDHALALESRTQALVRTTADAAEARASFIEKRAPSFTDPTTPRKVR